MEKIPFQASYFAIYYLYESSYKLVQARLAASLIMVWIKYPIWPGHTLLRSTLFKFGVQQKFILRKKKNFN